jgi:class 3 adenylate cyclase
MTALAPTLLAKIEPRLRWLLPADLYAAAWVDPSPATLTGVFEHLRTLQHILNDYIPRHNIEHVSHLGEVHCSWQEGTLMFTDLAGFTPLLESYARHGQAGAEALLCILNSYFSQMIQIISKSGGVLLEFTGDAMLVQFAPHKLHNDTAQAIRAGLRMQRAMHHFEAIETEQGQISLQMRIGIHSGRFLTSDIGTPRRMEHLLLGSEVQRTKQAENQSIVGRVCVSETAQAQAADMFRFEPAESGFALVVDDLTEEQLGEYEVAMGRRRSSTPLMLDRSVEGLVQTIDETMQQVEALASYMPRTILNLLIENASRRKIRPEFAELTVVFVNLPGVPDAADRADPGEEMHLIAVLSRAFALINAAVEARGGVLKNVTVDQIGSSLLIYFGTPDAHTNETIRAATVALAIRDIITESGPLIAGDNEMQQIVCQIGVAQGAAFAAEIGEPRGRREFNVLGDTVNTAARLMSRAEPNQILVTGLVQQQLASRFDMQALESMMLKGKSVPVPIFALQDWREGEDRYV